MCEDWRFDQRSMIIVPDSLVLKINSKEIWPFSSSENNEHQANNENLNEVICKINVPSCRIGVNKGVKDRKDDFVDIKQSDHEH